VLLGIPKKILIIAAAGIAGFIFLMGLGKNISSGSPGDSPSGGCKVNVTADVLNVRAQPAQNAPIVGKYQRDAKTDAQPEVQNGFRKIADNKWASAEFLIPVDGAKCG
jgi:hypothetical protein